jgi:hypothetical protein
VSISGLFVLIICELVVFVVRTLAGARNRWPDCENTSTTEQETESSDEMRFLHPKTVGFGAANISRSNPH